MTGYDFVVGCAAVVLLAALAVLAICIGASDVASCDRVNHYHGFDRKGGHLGSPPERRGAA